MAYRSTEPGSIMVVDDDPDVRLLLRRWLEDQGYPVDVFADGESCLAGLAHTLPDCICLDLQMPGLSGLETLERIKSHHPLLPVIVLTASSDVETVVSTMQAGAHDFLAKPLDQAKLFTTLRRAVEHHRMSVRLAQLEREVTGPGYGRLIGESPAMAALFRQMDRVAASDITVLIQGESGTGKELVAQALHDNSGRRKGPFVPVNCAAIPENLEESEFFGHEKGSFTGATTRRVGTIEKAHRGTLFLDEVGELSAALQAKLLRVLQERRFQRVGGSSEIASDFRLVTATHRDLEAAVRGGEFREDLFFRVAVFELAIPPLRARGDDIFLLADKFLDDISRREAARQEAGSTGLNGNSRPMLSTAARQLMSSYSWPGNVRELLNAVERAALVVQGEAVQPHDLPRRIWRRQGLNGPAETPGGVQPLEDVAGPGSAPSSTPGQEAWAEGPQPGQMGPVETEPVETEPVETEPAQSGQGQPADGSPPAIQTLEEIERDAIVRALERTGGNLSEVVRQLGIGRTTLYRKLKSYGLR